MKVLTFIFIKVPRKIFNIIFYKLEHLYYRFFHSILKLNINFNQKKYLILKDDNFDSLARTYHELFPDRGQSKIAEADLICEHIFDLLGSEPKKLTPKGKNYQPIDWHSDFKSEYRWNPKTFYRNIRWGHIEGVDVKVPWDLSRFQHLAILGEAYLLSGNLRYAKEYKNEISDWISQNKIGFGVNWTKAMNISIRAVNWLVGMEFFIKETDLLDKKFLTRFYTSIYKHGCFIKKNLQFNKNANTNHYLSGIAGLLFIAIYCPFFKTSNKWREFALKELENEIRKQVYPDGCDYEASTSYHLLVLEIFFYSFLLCERAGLSLTDLYKEKLRKMFEASLQYIKYHGMAPQIGDNDNGRFLNFVKRHILEHKYLLSLAAIYFNDRNFKLANFEFDEELYWLFGKKGINIWNKLRFSENSLRSGSLPNSGWFIIRHRSDYCFISCGPNGQSGKGGHAHNDKLSFELMLDGQDIIVDPGSYVYTSYPAERNKFRSTSYHNTISFYNREQNPLVDNLFELPDRVKINNAELTETDENIFFEGEIQYDAIKHRRVITKNKKNDYWNIEDRISSSRQLKGKLLFHLHPDVLYEDGYVFLRETNKKLASIEISNLTFQKGTYDYSPEYGIKVKAECLFACISTQEHFHCFNICIKKV